MKHEEKMKIYFIGGLGSNEYHALDFFKALNQPATFLNPYHVEITRKEDLIAWFSGELEDDTKVCLIAHSLGADMARFLATQCPQVTLLILLDGGYLDLDQLMTLEDELKSTEEYFKTQTFPDIEAVISEEKKGARYWSNNLEKAIRESFKWNEKEQKFELALDREKVFNLLKLRRELKASDIILDATKVLLIVPDFHKDQEWRTKALNQVPSSFEMRLLEDSGHELYTERPNELAHIIHQWLEKSAR